MGLQGFVQTVHRNQTNKESMDKIKKAWEWLSGKKTTIGAILYVISSIAEQFAATQPYANAIRKALEFWFAGSLAHKGVKTDIGQAFISTIKSLLSKNK